MKLVELQAQAWLEVLEHCHKLGMTIPESGKSALDAVKDFIAAQQGVQRTGLDAYTYEELAKEIVKRGFHVALTPRR